MTPMVSMPATRGRCARLLGGACLLLSAALMALALVCGGPAQRAATTLCDIAVDLPAKVRG